MFIINVKICVKILRLDTLTTVYSWYTVGGPV